MSEPGQNVKDAKQLNRWFKLHCIFCAVPAASLALGLFGLILAEFLESQGLDPDGTFGLLGRSLFIIGGILVYVLMVPAIVFSSLILHKLWSLIPPLKARTTPGKAVRFLFIPLFNFYWHFVAIYGLAKALNAETGRKSVSERASFIVCFSFLVPFVLPVGGVLWFVILRQMKNAGILILQADKA